jgi:hypothetical protein
MNLLYIISEYLPDSGGGIITHYSRMLPQLVRRGHSVKVILASAGKLDQPTYEIDGLRPILSPHFNITVELPLKAIVRGYSFATMPITWRNRRTGVAKLKIKEMGSRYLFICLYIWLEKYFSQGDYRKK